MSNASDFIIENGVLIKYVGPGGDVVIPEGITRISRFGAGFVTSITIPEGVVSIGPDAFWGNNMLKKVILPESLKDAGFNMFGDYSYVEYIGSKGSQKVQSEGKRTIVCSDELLSVLWSGICADWKREICYYQLQKQGQTDEKMAPVVKTYVSKNKKAFLDLICEEDDVAAMESFLSVGKKPALGIVDAYLESARGKESLTAFLLAYKAKNFTQDNIQTYTEEHFEKELGLREYTVADWRNIFRFSNKDGKVIISEYKGTDTEITIPAKIGKSPVGSVSISYYQRWRHINIELCQKITKVAMEQGVEHIGQFGFANCSALEEMIIPDGMITIGKYAFKYCTKLASIKIPESVTFIGTDALQGCPNLTIHAPAGSYAEQYAKENNIPFVAE